MYRSNINLFSRIFKIKNTPTNATYSNKNMDGVMEINRKMALD